MLYHYVDETYKRTDGYWHCNIGGLLVPSNRLLDMEMAFCEAMSKCTSREEPVYVNEEFKYSDFFRGKSDELKWRLFAELVGVVRDFDLQLVVSHAMIAEWKMKASLNVFKNAHIMIQSLTWMNMSRYLAGVTANTHIQTVVDLGINESFRPVYDLYVGSLRSIPYMSSMGIKEECITLPNYRNYPMPLFVDSRDSKAIQFSDTVIGLLLAHRTNALSPFLAGLYQALSPIQASILQYSVEWNKDAV